METKNNPQISRTQFYAMLKQVSLAKLKPLSQAQVNGINHILDEWDSK